MTGELLTFGAFLALQGLFHSLEKVHNFPLIAKLANSHWLIWVFHPAVLHTVRDYGVHFVIYSGQVIGAH